VYLLAFRKELCYDSCMSSERAVLRLNAAILKLLKVIGSPEWYQGISSEWKDDKPTIVLLLNRMIPAETVKYNIPVDIDNIPIKIIYRSPSSRARFYGKDGPSIRN
jgi:hypothetical protein